MRGWWGDKHETLVSNCYDSCGVLAERGPDAPVTQLGPFGDDWGGTCHIEVGVRGGTSQRGKLGVGVSTVVQSHNICSSRLGAMQLS